MKCNAGSIAPDIIAAFVPVGKGLTRPRFSQRDLAHKSITADDLPRSAYELEERLVKEALEAGHLLLRTAAILPLQEQAGGPNCTESERCHLRHVYPAAPPLPSAAVPFCLRVPLL